MLKIRIRRQRQNWLSLVALVCAASFAQISCDDGAGSSTQQDSQAPDVGLKAIRQRGVLRLLTRNNGNTYFILRGKQLGFDYTMAERFAQSIGVKLEVIVPPGWNDLIPMILDGQGDIIGAAMNITPERAKKVTYSRPYGLTHMRIVWGRGQKRIGNIEELSGKQVHVRQGSTYYNLLDRVSGLFESAGKRRVDIIIEGETLETEQILADVASGKIPYSLCDYHICVENKARLPGLVIGPAVGDPEPIAWAMHPQAEDLKGAIDQFFSEQRGGDFKEVYDRYYGDPKARRRALPKGTTGRISGGKLSTHDGIFRVAAKQYKLDWRLLASIAFQESGFDPGHKSWSGGRGLFGMDPGTAKALGIKDLRRPNKAAEAAAAHLTAMNFHFASVDDEDDRMRFGIAAYQCGNDHISDAQELARREGLNAEKWTDVAKVLPLLALRDYAAKAPHGYVQGADTVRYVENVWERYRAYKHALGERDKRSR